MSKYYFTHFNGRSFSKYVQEYEKISAFIDYNNNITGTYSENSAINIVAEYKTTGKYTMYKTILQTILQFLANNKDTEIIIHSETGASQYHLGLNKDYKSRKGGWLIMSPEDSQTFMDINQSLRKLTQDFVARYIPRVRCVNYHYMEADIVPYLWVKYKEPDENRYYIICSNDKDLTQCLQYKNVIFQHRQSTKIKEEMKRFITPKNIVATITSDYTFEENENLSPHIVPFLLSISGDSVDNVKGIKSYGYKSVYNIIKKAIAKNKQLEDALTSMYTSINEIKEIYNLLIQSVDSKSAKKLEDNLDTVILNHQLCDFKIIQTYMQTKYKEQVKEEIQRKHDIIDPDEFVQFVKEIIWDDAEFLLKCKQAYSKIISTVN